ncbi:MAG: hypothetical protein AB7K64_16965 [Variibacter sp.]
MQVKTRTIEIPESTADALETRAAAEGVSVDRMINTLLSLQSSAEDELAELERRWAAVQAGERTIPHSDVVRWLKTWGTSDFASWPK